ncbi:hypothetical protein MEO94_24235 [Dolichospermum sp. ST_sed9]|jgi:hypothetical protein|nr:hypothetical protein [Dolichospermum sp. ST_sed9]
MNAPVNLLKGVGDKTAEKMAKEGIKTFSDLLQYKGNDTKIKSFRERCNKMCDFEQNNNFHYDDDIIKNVFWWVVINKDLSA